MSDRRMTDLSRRSFTLGMTTLAVAAPAIVRAQDLTKVKITQPSESLSYMPIYVGRARDYFKEAGIDLQLVVTRGDGPDVQALMAKEVEFVATPPHHLYTLYLQNRKLLGVCGILGRCGINMVIGKEEAAERNVREAVIPNGRMTAAGSDAYQRVLLQTGHLKEAVAFDAVFTNQYLPT